MNKFLMILTLAIASPMAFANELDRDVSNQKRLSKDLPKVTIVRVNEKTKEVSVLHSLKALDKQIKVSDADLEKSGFVAVTSSKAPSKSELDRDSSQSGWFFYFGGGWSFPTYYFYGYNYVYRPYYNYYWGGCNYQYYSWY